MSDDVVFLHVICVVSCDNVLFKCYFAFEYHEKCYINKCFKYSIYYEVI